MIEYVKGQLVDIETQYVVIDFNGLGYQLFCPNPYVFERSLEQEIQIYTYHYVKEDLIRLYGFQTKKERNLFERLLNVSGIGPKGALAILASGAPDQVVGAIEKEDEAFLVKFPGVGKKTARQMILDLKGKLEDFINIPLQADGQLAAEPLAFSSSNDSLEEAEEALRALGYVEKEIKKVRPKLEKENLSTDAYIRKALQLMLRL
ncbi:Holliday junction branch migration protein RuvA [Alkalihalobacillus trypoxylicola]|uniref:Holliday junction branch migration complex subunit RuvA n=1 Tax=Alkalihalobacillus trypoxylicola TaxID=519424 RepID=A0A162E6D0_9BACI|nr:Holliday junction branch migration protein RuvA [Alkalihalobacillus trypoxylicola]KYG31862.1 Holliday junction ATP-dependent DNA helicase RuvA [Alkalihalobacillus trypoxylicola]